MQERHVPLHQGRDELTFQPEAGAPEARRLPLHLPLVFILLALGQALQTLGARSRFEAALTASEQRHRALVEDQSEPVSLAREDGTLV